MTTKKINDAETYWIKIAQDEATKDGNHSAIASKLELETDEKGVLRCKGRIIPRNHRLSSLVVRDAHEHTLHGGVGLNLFPTHYNAQGSLALIIFFSWLQAQFKMFLENESYFRFVSVIKSRF